MVEEHVSVGERLHFAGQNSECQGRDDLVRTIWRHGSRHGNRP